MTRLNRKQFGLKSLFALTVAAAFTIVIWQFLAGVSEDVLIVTLVMAVVSALVGVAMIGLSILFAIGIAVTDETAPLRKSNLWQCFHMFVMGLVAMGPSMLMIVILIS